LKFVDKLSLVSRRNKIPGAKCIKQMSSAVTNVADGGMVSTTADDSDVCEVEWDSPRPLSSNVS